MEDFEVKKYYEWQSGNRAGIVEVYVAETDNQVYFQSGRFVDKEQLDILLRQVDEGRYKQKGGDNQFLPPPPPPPNTPQTLEDWEKLLGNPEPTSIAPPKPKQEKEKSPIKIILEKQKKLKEETINVSLTLRLPSPKVYEFLSMMFDEDEVIGEITEFAYSQISSDLLNDAIKETIKNYIVSNSDIKEAE
jgi:hypothetical protein